ncbi:ABC transporter permease [Thermosediminibacter litoriperuensis]|uniref:NitT/TauT family transport system permease protein n=1 Tax=Thermosediminibacter litoriperuensis TaxID=291989 RepID=A0A5S5AJ32_9FIRM|nr:ABC transporter permease [Thermosediminibacter litoriperuensis]TYP50893.1 NitT/TauT family transport system permease protein [Thermosediminibacter litoriperuensis]
MNAVEEKPNRIIKREEISEGASKSLQRRAFLFQILSFLSPLLLLLLWEILARLNAIDVRLFSSPSRIFAALVPLVSSGELLYHTLVSAWRILLGFIVGAVPGVLLGLSMGLFPPVKALLQPLVAVTFPIPKLAVMPLILIIFGLGESSKVFTIAIGVFYLVLINTMAGVLNIDTIYMDVARSFGASRVQFYTTVALPGALPMIFAGLKLGMGTALLLIVAAELSAARAGVGWMIWRAYDMFDIEKMFCALIVLAFLGYIFSYVLDFVEKVVIPWKNR